MTAAAFRSLPRFRMPPVALLALRHANVLGAGHFRVAGHFFGSRLLMFVLVFGGGGSGAGESQGDRGDCDGGTGNECGLH